MLKRLRFKAVLNLGREFPIVRIETVNDKLLCSYISTYSPGNEKFILGNPFVDSCIQTKAKYYLVNVSLFPLSRAFKTLLILYRANWDGWDLPDFLSKSNKKIDTITVIEITEGNVFLGYLGIF